MYRDGIDGLGKDRLKTDSRGLTRCPRTLSCTDFYRDVKTQCTTIPYLQI